MKKNIKEPTGSKCVLDRKAVNQLRIWSLGAPSVKGPTLDLSSGIDLSVVNSSLTLGSMLGVQPTLKKRKKEEEYGLWKKKHK